MSNGDHIYAIHLGDQTFNIHGPEGLAETEVVSRAMGANQDFASAYRNYKLFHGKTAKGAAYGGLVPGAEATEATPGGKRQWQAGLPPEVAPVLPEMQQQGIVSPRYAEPGKEGDFPERDPGESMADYVKRRQESYDEGGQLVAATLFAGGFRGTTAMLKSPQAFLQGAKALAKNMIIGTGTAEVAKKAAQKAGAGSTVSDIAGIIGFIYGTRLAKGFSTEELADIAEGKKGFSKSTITALMKRIPGVGAELEKRAQLEARMAEYEKWAEEVGMERKRVAEAHQAFEEELNKHFNTRMKELADNARMAQIEAADEAKALKSTVGKETGPEPAPEGGPSSKVSVGPGGYLGPKSVPKPTPPPKPESGDILKGPMALQHKAVRAGQAKVAGLAERKVVPIGETPEPQPEPPEAEEGPEGTTPSPVTPSSAEKPAASAGGATVPKPLRSAPATTPAAQAKKYGLELREPSVKGSKMTSFGDSITGGSIEMPEGYTEEDLAAKVREKRAIGDLSKTARQKGKSATERFKAEHGKEPPEATPPRALRSVPRGTSGLITTPKEELNALRSIPKHELERQAEGGDIRAIDALEEFYGKRTKRWDFRRQYPGTAGTKVE